MKHVCTCLVEEDVRESEREIERREESVGREGELGKEERVEILMLSS